MGAIDIGWVCLRPEFDMLVFPPEPLIRTFATSPDRLPSRCPAIREAYTQYFVIRSPIDVYLEIDSDGNLRGKPESVRDFEQYVSMFDAFKGKERRFDDIPQVQFKLPLAFTSDTPDVKMTILPPLMDYKTWPIRGIPGRFNIFDWPCRNISLAFEWMDTSKPLIIKRGEPLMYVQFQHSNIEAKFRMVEMQRTQEVVDIGKGIGKVNSMARNTKSLLSLFGQRRPRKLIVPRNK